MAQSNFALSLFWLSSPFRECSNCSHCRRVPEALERKTVHSLYPLGLCERAVSTAKSVGLKLSRFPVEG